MEPQFGILGPLEVVVGGRRLDVGGPKPRRLLAALVLDVGRAVSVDRLTDALWDDRPPGNAEVTLRAHVAALRRTFAGTDADEMISTRSRGYCLQVDREQVDACRFERIVDEGRAALDGGDAARAADTLREALALWRGAVLDDLDRPRFAEMDAARLEELRLVTLEARIEADLALRRHRDVVAELEALVEAHPFREHMTYQLMLALYRSERQADALATYRAVRERLDEELGLAPGQALAGLETAILRQDPTIAVPEQGPLETAVAGSTPPFTALAPSTGLFDVVGRTAMVGRADDLERLHEHWRVVRDGGRRVVVLSGEAGVGKTRLVAELAHLVADDQATVVVGHCDQTALIPYQPVTEALRASPEVAELVAEAPGSLTSRLAVLVDRAAGPGHGVSVWTEDVDAQQLALFDAVVDLFARMTAAAPVMFVIEDAEAIDWASARLLRHLARSLPEHLLLLICLRDPPASRHPPLGELLADLERRGLADRVRLSPLSEGDLAALVASRTGSEAPVGFVQALWSSTGGNPFYAGEVVDDLSARGSFDRDDDAWRVPEGVRDVFRERLRTLTAATREVISCAAVLGREIDFTLLTRMTDATGEGVVGSLEEATDSGWVVEASRRTGEASYAFRHPLMREAVLADLPAPRRQQLHLRAADALEAEEPKRPADVAATAVHLRAAGRLIDRTRAAEASLRAADEAAGMYAWDEAIAHAEAAVAILARVGAPPTRQAEAAVRAARLLELSGTDYPRAIHHLEMALEHAHATGDEAAVAETHSFLGYVLTAHHDVMDIPRALDHFDLAEAAISRGVPAFELHRGKAQAAMYGLRTEQGLAAARRALEVAEQLGRDDLGASARSLLACQLFSSGEVALPLAMAADVWDVGEQLDDPRLMWDAAFGAAWISNVYLLDHVAGETWCRRGLAQPRLMTIRHAREGLRDHLAYALASQGAMAPARELTASLDANAITHRLLQFLDGDWQAAERSWDRALADDLDNGDLIDAALNACWLGQVRWLMGREADAVVALRRAQEIGLEGPHVATELMARAELARILASAGYDEAPDHLTRCDELLTGEDDWRGLAGVVELARGVLASAQGDQDEVDAAHERALAVFTAHELPWKRAETLRSWARCCALAHREDEAADRRRAAMQIYDQLGAAPRWHRSFVPSG